MLYHQHKSGRMAPRQIFIDYVENFGNFSSCFALEKASKVQPNWGGNVEVKTTEPIPLSNFHQELIDFEQANFYAEEDKNSDYQEEVEDMYDEEEEEKEDFVKKLMRQGKTTKEIFDIMFKKEQELLQVAQEEKQEEQIDTAVVEKPKAKDTRNLTEYY